MRDLGGHSMLKGYGKITEQPEGTLTICVRFESGAVLIMRSLLYNLTHFLL